MNRHVIATPDGTRPRGADDRQRGRGDDGAVIVEAALVLPMLLLLVFGMIDFGVNLSDQISVREGVREGVRQAVVDAPGAQSVAEVVALTKERIGVADGTRVRVQPEASQDAPVGQKGSNVSVCAYVPMRSVSGLYSSVLDDQYMWSRVTMRVEQDLGYTTSSGSDAAPGGHDWSRCTAGSDEA
jgi:hypothetical protein